jgi:hypothetical protein
MQTAVLSAPFLASGEETPALSPARHFWKANGQASHLTAWQRVSWQQTLVKAQGDIMAEMAEEERQAPVAEAVAVAIYSVLVLLLMLAWTYA